VSPLTTTRWHTTRGRKNKAGQSRRTTQYTPTTDTSPRDDAHRGGAGRRGISPCCVSPPSPPPARRKGGDSGLVSPAYPHLGLNCLTPPLQPKSRKTQEYRASLPRRPLLGPVLGRSLHNRGSPEGNGPSRGRPSSGRLHIEFPPRGGRSGNPTTVGVPAGPTRKIRRRTRSSRMLPFYR